MIANVSPCQTHVEDSHNTLKYACRTKDLKIFVSNNVRSISVARDKIVKQLKSEIELLQ